MRIKLEDLTEEHVRHSLSVVAIVPGAESCEEIRPNRRVAPLYGRDTAARLMPNDLEIEVADYSGASLLAVHARLSALGFAQGLAPPPAA